MLGRRPITARLRLYVAAIGKLETGCLSAQRGGANLGPSTGTQWRHSAAINKDLSYCARRGGRESVMLATRLYSGCGRGVAVLSLDTVPRVREQASVRDRASQTVGESLKVGEMKAREGGSTMERGPAPQIDGGSDRAGFPCAYPSDRAHKRHDLPCDRLEEGERLRGNATGRKSPVTAPVGERVADAKRQPKPALACFILLLLLSSAV